MRSFGLPLLLSSTGLSPDFSATMLYELLFGKSRLKELLRLGLSTSIFKPTLQMSLRFVVKTRPLWKSCYLLQQNI